MDGTIPPITSSRKERALLIGTNAEGEPVELTFTDFEGRVRVAGNIVCRVEGSSDRAIRELMSAFTYACRKQVSGST